RATGGPSVAARSKCRLGESESEDSRRKAGAEQQTGSQPAHVWRWQTVHRLSLRRVKARPNKGERATDHAPLLPRRGAIPFTVPKSGENLCQSAAKVQ